MRINPNNIIPNCDSVSSVLIKNRIKDFFFTKGKYAFVHQKKTLRSVAEGSKTELHSAVEEKNGSEIMALNNAKNSLELNEKRERAVGKLESKLFLDFGILSCMIS